MLPLVHTLPLQKISIKLNDVLSVNEQVCERNRHFGLDLWLEFRSNQAITLIFDEYEVTSIFKTSIYL